MWYVCLETKFVFELHNRSEAAAATSRWVEIEKPAK